MCGNPIYYRSTMKPVCWLRQSHSKIVSGDGSRPGLFVIFSISIVASPESPYIREGEIIILCFLQTSEISRMIFLVFSSTCFSPCLFVCFKPSQLSHANEHLFAGFVKYAITVAEKCCSAIRYDTVHTKRPVRFLRTRRLCILEFFHICIIPNSRDLSRSIDI